jgi:hypothetical protein
MSGNQIARISPVQLAHLAALNALILSHNEIAALERDSFAALKNLNTLVLSHNKLSELPEGMLAGMASLKKVSLAHNQLKAFPVGLPKGLQELRLNDNKIPTPSIKPEFPFSLTLLDVGNNLLKSLEPALAPALADLPGLVNLTLKGNPVCALPGYRESILLSCSEAGGGTGLRVLDGNRFDEKFLRRKEKMVGYKKKKEFKEKKKAAAEALNAACLGSGEDSGSEDKRANPKPVKPTKRRLGAEGDTGPDQPVKKIKQAIRKDEKPAVGAKPKYLMLVRPPSAGPEPEPPKKQAKVPIASTPVVTDEGAEPKKTRRGRRAGKGAPGDPTTAPNIAKPVGNGPSASEKGTAKLAERRIASKPAGQLKATVAAKADRAKATKPASSGSKPDTKSAAAKPTPAPAQDAEKSEEAQRNARSGVVAVIDNSGAKGKKKIGTTASGFDPSALEKTDAFATPLLGWD